MGAVAIERLGELVARGGVCVLSGAGLSTESGIPDYRGPSGALRARLPMTIAEFRGSPGARLRYWARAHVGWRRIAAARPNVGHRSVAALQEAGVLRGIITQYVDGLHQAAGARDSSSCTERLTVSCAWSAAPAAPGRRLTSGCGPPTRTWTGRAGAASNPDGDAELDDVQVARFRLVECECCGADLLKPDVVFFGESVPRARVQRCFELRGRLGLPARAGVLADGDVRAAVRHRARQAQIPVAIINRGTTRGDPLADLKVDAGLGDVLRRWPAQSREPGRSDARPAISAAATHHAGARLATPNRKRRTASR